MSAVLLIGHALILLNAVAYAPVLWQLARGQTAVAVSFDVLIVSCVTALLWLGYGLWLGVVSLILVSVSALLVVGLLAMHALLPVGQTRATVSRIVRLARQYCL